MRYNAETMRNNGATEQDIEKYLGDNDANWDVILAVPTPNERELQRMLASEKDGSFAERSAAADTAAKRASRSRAWLKGMQNAQGAIRAAAQGVSLNTADEIESVLTGQPVEEIRAEQREFEREHPNWALGLELAGGFAPAVVTLGSSVAAPAASLGKRMLAQGALGAGMGGVAGFAGGEGDFENRAESALFGGLVGAGIGSVTPALMSGASAGARAASRVLRGLGENSASESQIAEAILRNVVEEAGKPGAAAKRNANILFQAAQRGDEGILDAATNLENKITGMRAMREPGLVEKAPNPRWSSETPSANRIMQAYDTAARRQAGADFAAFASQQPDKTGAGLVLNEFFKRNPVAADIIKVNQRRVGTELTTYEGLQKIEDVLRRNLPKNFDTKRAVNRSAKIEDALEDLSQLRETLFPGQKAIDAEYAAAMNAVQNPAQKVADARISQIATGVPQTMTPEISLTGVSRLAFTPYVRGRARELIERGALKPEYSGSVDKILQALGLSGHNTLSTAK